MLKLDLTSNSVLSQKYSSLYSKTYLSSLSGFNHLIKRLADRHFDNLDWWMSNPASRNIQETNLFQNYCKVQFLISILNTSEKINQIVVDSESLIRVLRQIPGLKNTDITVQKKNNFYKYLSNLRIFLSQLLIILSKCSRFVIFKLFFKKTCNYPFSNIRIIDTYVHPGFYAKDRYYNGILDHLSPDEKLRTYFVPTITNTSIFKAYGAFNEMLSANRNFLFKEFFLSFSDIISACLYIFRIKSIKVNEIEHNGLDYSSIINESFQEPFGVSISIEGLINFKFIKRLKESNVSIAHFVDWWENQSSDKGFHIAMNKFYPDTSTVGYLGFVPSQLELHLHPTKYESYHKVIPNEIGLIGMGFVDQIKKYGPIVDLNAVPAFRYNHLWDKKNEKRELGDFKILLGLPISLSESLHILNMVNSILDKLHIEDLCIWVKVHPSIEKSKIIGLLSDSLSSKFQFIDYEAPKALKRSNLMISALSSLCLESIAVNVPVLIVNNIKKITPNPIPKKIKQEIWRMCNNQEDLLDGIQYFNKIDLEEKKRFLKISEKIRKNYFKPVNKKDARIFLGLK